MMKLRTTLLTALAIGATLAGTAGASAAPRLTGEEKLAKELKGRVAGEPVSCINMSQVRSTRIIDKTAILYDAGRTIYVNRPDYPRALDSHDVMVTRLHGSQLCTIDIVRVHESGSFFPRGAIGLGKFVPYRKAS